MRILKKKVWSVWCDEHWVEVSHDEWLHLLKDPAQPTLQVKWVGENQGHKPEGLPFFPISTLEWQLLSKHEPPLYQPIPGWKTGVKDGESQ